MENYDKQISKQIFNYSALIANFRHESVKNSVEDVFLRNNFGKCTVLIKNSNMIHSLLEFLAVWNTDPSLEEKVELIEVLTRIFEILPHNIEIFMKASVSHGKMKKINLIQILVDCYLNFEFIDLDEDLEIAIRKCLDQMISHFDFTKEIFDYVYQKLSIYFRVPINEQILNKKILNKYLSLLTTLYGENMNSSRPSNYFYFSGNGGIKVNEQILQTKEDKIKLSQGCVISFWFKLCLDFNDNNLPTELSRSDLINIKCTRDQSIQISLYNNKLIIKNYSDKEYVKEFEIGEWNHISLIIKPKSFRRSTEFVLVFNDVTKSLSIPNFNCDCEILEASFFNNLVGNVTSIILLNKAISEEYVKLFKDFSFGIHKEKSLFQLMRKSFSKYMENSNSPYRTLNTNSQKDSEGFTSLIENFKFFYTPFRCSSNATEKIIYDICGKYNATITSDFLNGVHLHRNLQKNIFYIGGINTILPIMELMWTNSKLLLDVDIFCNFMEIVFIILNYRKKNMNDAVQKKFFQMLSLYIEQFPKEFFNEKILCIFLKIGRGLFSLVDQCGLSTIYFDEILLNEKIFTKFDIDIQIEMWKSIYQFYVSDSSQIKSFMKMKKISFVLRYYEAERFTKFCCEEHCNFFTHDEEKNKKPLVMSPDMKTKIEDLINIIQLIIDNSQLESDDHETLFKLLSLDLSPCLQKMIIRIFINFLKSDANVNIRSSRLLTETFDKKKKVFAILLNNNFIEVVLYLFSVSLLDIRCEIIRLLNVVSSFPFKELMKKHEERIYPFLTEFIIPNNLLTYKNRQLNSDNIVISKREKGLCVVSSQEAPKIGLTIKSKNSTKEVTETTENTKEEVFIKKGFISARNADRKSFKFDAEKIESFVCKENEDESCIEIIRKRKFNMEVGDVINEEKEKEKAENNNLILNDNQENFKLTLMNKKVGKKKLNLEINKTEEESSLLENTTNTVITDANLTDTTTHPINAEPITSTPTKKTLSDNNINFISFDHSDFEPPTLDPFISSHNLITVKSSELSELFKSYSTPTDTNDIKDTSNPKAPKGFSSIRLKRTLTTNTDKINIDTEIINKNYKFGGEKAEMNISEEEEEKKLEYRIRQLAKHCVDFINGIASSADCCDESKFEDNPFKKAASQDINFGKVPLILNQPRSVKGTSKINFNKIAILKDQVIEEDPNETSNSPSKSKASGMKSAASRKLSDANKIPEKENEYCSNNSANSNLQANELNEVKMKLSFEGLKITAASPKSSDQEKNNSDIVNLPVVPSRNIEIVDDYMLADKKNDSSNRDERVRPSKIEREAESMMPHFNKEKYSEQLSNLYEICLEWLLNKNETDSNSSSNKTLYPDDNDDIMNPEVINVIVKLASNSEISYVQRLMQDFHLMLLNNKDNCVLLFKNSSFYPWLIETCFRHYQASQHDQEGNDNVNTSYSIYELGKKIHTELIINTILKEEKLKSKPINKINFLLSWGVYYKNVYDHSRKIIGDVNEFIKNLLKDILNAFKDKVAICSPNINLSLWESFISFTILCYEYMTFYNLEKSMKNNSIGLAEMSYESIIVPRSILSGLNYQDPVGNTAFDHNASPSLTELWCDYKMFENIYTCYNKIWNVNKTILGSNTTNSFANTIIKFERVIEDFIHNKKRKDLFLDDLRILTYYYKADFSNIYNCYDVPLIKCMSNLFTITISLIQDEKEIVFWLEEYEQFLIFLIVASSNMTMNSLDYYNLVQDLTVDTVLFGLCFLLDEYFNSKKNSKMCQYYAKCIKNVFALCALIMDYIFKHRDKKKKSIFTSLMKKKKNDLTKCAVFKIFNEHVVDSNGAPVLTLKMVKEMKFLNFYDVPQMFRNDIWKQGLTESPSLKEKLRKVFDFAVYETIMKERDQVIRKYVPIYGPKLSVKNSDDFITSPATTNNQTPLKNSVYKTIENNLPQVDFEIKNYKNNVFISSKQRKKVYRLIKKKLFSWRGMWSDRDLFFNHPEKLKLKVLNHYTSQFARPLLIPILDVEYYIPKFSRFNTKNLFTDKEIAYKICLNVNHIFDKNSNEKSEEEKEFHLQKMEKSLHLKNNYNYLKDIYKLNDLQIWSKYSDINTKLEFLTKTDSEYTEVYLNRFRVKSSDVNLRKYENSYECCFVKASHHIRGIFYMNKDGITFRVLVDRGESSSKENSSGLLTKNSFEIVEKDDDFNGERNTCYGSFFELHPKDRDTLNFNFPYNEIKYIFKKRYYYKKSALEMFTTNSKSYYFNFKSFSDREMVIKAITSHMDAKRDIKIDTKDGTKDKEELVIGYENMSTSLSQSKKSAKAEYLSNKIDSWLNWKISNFEFLMWLNILSNRSFADLTQYPVFPWAIKNYTDDKISLPEDMREFDLPMGMMELDEKGTARKKLYMEDFRSMINERDMNDAPRVYGSHYSNPIYVSHYLTRLFPFSHIMIELQGDRFDDPNRLFISIANSFSCATSLKGDVRELTPEFYYLPEFFLNMNNLNLGIRTDSNMNKQVVHNVELPEWCDNNPYEFIVQMRTALESEEVSMSINNWIDLIFGYKQRGKECENTFNVYPHWSYEDFNLDLVDPGEKCSFMAQIEFGLTPLQLITNKPLSEKFAKDHIRRGKQLTESKELRSYGNSSLGKSNKNKERPLMLKIKVLDTDKAMCVLNNNIYNICKFTPSNDYKYNMEIVSKNYISHDSAFKITNRMTELYNDPLVNHPIIIYNSGKTIAQAGYWDGRIAISYHDDNTMKLYYYCTDLSPIVVLTIDKSEQYVYAGSKMGVLYFFKINDYAWKLEHTIFDHTQEITSIFISNTLNLFATSSLDGFVNLYTFPENKLIRAIQLKDCISADYVFLSSSPLPSIAVYSKTTRTFYSYSINGYLLCEEFDDCKHLMSPVVLTDISFTDYLIYGTNTSEFKIRKFPHMNLHHRLTLAEWKNPSEANTIKCLDITEDKKFAYIWLLDEQDITLIKDPSVTSEAATVNLINMGFGY